MHQEEGRTEELLKEALPLIRELKDKLQEVGMMSRDEQKRFEEFRSQVVNND